MILSPWSLWFLCLSAAWATSFNEVPFPDAVEEAPIIVRGTTGDSYADWGMGRDGVKRIYTFTPLDVQERIKGDSGQEASLLMRELGGEKDGVGMQVSGVARFQKGEDVVVFLNPVVEAEGQRSYDLRGMMMGKYQIVRDESGEEILKGAGILSSEDPHARHFREGLEAQGTIPPPAKWTLGSLRKLVQQQPEKRESLSGASGRLKKTKNSNIPDEKTGPLDNMAPALQNSDSKEATDRSWWKNSNLRLGLGVLSLLLLIWRQWRS